MNDVKDIMALYMMVPCCKGLNNQVKGAVKRSDKSIPLKSYVVGIGEDISEARVYCLNPISLYLISLIQPSINLLYPDTYQRSF